MSDSICRFMPAKNEDASIKAVRFVYETECHTLSQPFYHPIYVLHIVTKGTATLKISEKCYSLKTLNSLLIKNGFEIIKVVSDFEGTPVSDTDERAYFVCRAIK